MHNNLLIILYFHHSAYFHEQFLLILKRITPKNLVSFSQFLVLLCCHLLLTFRKTENKMRFPTPSFFFLNLYAERYRQLHFKLLIFDSSSGLLSSIEAGENAVMCLNVLATLQAWCCLFNWKLHSCFLFRYTNLLMPMKHFMLMSLVDLIFENDIRKHFRHYFKDLQHVLLDMMIFFVSSIKLIYYICCM